MSLLQVLQRLRLTPRKRQPLHGLEYPTPCALFQLTLTASPTISFTLLQPCLSPSALHTLSDALWPQDIYSCCPHYRVCSSPRCLHSYSLASSRYSPQWPLPTEGLLVLNASTPVPTVLSPFPAISLYH